MHYKAPDNSLHFIEPGFEHMLPAGSIQITEEEAKSIRVLNTPRLSSAELKDIELKRVRTLRLLVLDRLSGIAGRASRSGDLALAEACDTAAVALLNITENLPQDHEAVKAEILVRYATLRATALNIAPSLDTAFSQFDS